MQRVIVEAAGLSPHSLEAEDLGLKVLGPEKFVNAVADRIRNRRSPWFAGERSRDPALQEIDHVIDGLSYEPSFTGVFEYQPLSGRTLVLPSG